MLLRLWLPIILLGVAAFALTFSRLEPPAPRHLTIASGGSSGAYFKYASAYGRYLEENGFTLEVLETAGSAENLELLTSGKVDLALLQGGVTDASRSPTLELLGSLYFEPFWVFHRAELEIDRLTDLAGHRLAVGPEGSGTRVLALELLADNDIDDGSGVGDGADLGNDAEAQGGPAAVRSGNEEPQATERTELVPISGPEAAEALVAGQLDAAFFVASASASYVKDLLAAQSVDLLSLRRFRAYKVRHPYLSAVILGEGVIDLEENLPTQDVRMVAAAATLATRRDLHHALVPVLVDAMEHVHGGPDLFVDAGHFPSNLYVDLPLKAEAEHYLENGPSFLYKILPYRTAAAVDRLKILLLPFIPLLLVVFKMAPPVYRWRIRSRIYRWYEDLRELDEVLLTGADAAQAETALAQIRELEKEITEVTVPLSYMDEFYSLRLHLELIQNKLEEISAEAES